MGHSTDFEGRFVLDRKLAPEHVAYLKAFSETRRMKRDASIAATMPDPIRTAVCLPIGDDAAYFVGGGGFHGQDRDASIVDYNDEPTGQPGLWCQWIPSEDGLGIEWDGGEKFYDYVGWAQYLVDHFLTPWGYKLWGSVKWQGEDSRDCGVIRARPGIIWREESECSEDDEPESDDMAA